VKTRLIQWWESRSPRDRKIIVAVAVVAAVLLYLLLVQSANRARAQLGASVAVLRAQALRFEQDAAELARVRAVRPPADTPADLRSQVQSQAAAAGLASSLVRLDAADADHVQVAFGSVPFSDWLDWIAALQMQRIRLESARIEALYTPGLVGVTATLARAKAQ
jgi:general secretion pathway protein M